MRSRWAAQGDKRVRLFDKGERQVLCAAPILAHDDMEGDVLIAGLPGDRVPDEECANAVTTAANFLARWMEE